LKHPVLSCVLALCLVATGGATALPWSLDLEAAMVQASRNDVGIPGDSGTRFSLVDDLSTDEDVAFRIRLGRRLGDRQRLTVLYAPLRLYAAGQPGFAIDFNGESFASDADLSAVYQFNSYRLTWSYDLVQDRNVDLALGLTGKVRDAFIELSDGETTARKDDRTAVAPAAGVALDRQDQPGIRGRRPGRPAGSRRGRARSPRAPAVATGHAAPGLPPARGRR
jgi:hypothetical protein